MYRYVMENVTIVNNDILQVNNMVLKWLNLCLTKK